MSFLVAKSNFIRGFVRQSVGQSVKTREFKQIQGNSGKFNKISIWTHRCSCRTCYFFFLPPPCFRGLALDHNITFDHNIKSLSRICKIITDINFLEIINIFDLTKEEFSIWPYASSTPFDNYVKREVIGPARASFASVERYECDVFKWKYNCTT